MKIGKRIAVMLLVFLMIVTCVMPGIVPTAKAAISSSTYSTKVQEFINNSRWRNGTSWDGNHRESSDVSSWQSWGCCAYCADFAGYVYGSRYAWSSSDFAQYWDAAEIRPGDIIYYTYINSKGVAGEHWFVVLDRNRNSLYTAEANVWVAVNTYQVRISDQVRSVENGQLKNTSANETITSFTGYHYNFADSYYAQQYVDQCTGYSTYGTITVAKDNANINDRPCSKETDETIRVLERGAINDVYTITKVYKNTQGNYWFQVRTKYTNEVGFIYSGNCIYNVSFEDTVLNNANIPAKLPMNTRITFGGTVTTTATKLHSVTVNLYKENGKFFASSTKDAVNNVVDLSGFAFDVSFDKPTTLKCEIVANVGHYNINTEKYSKGSTRILHQSDILLTCATHSWGNWTLTQAPTCTTAGSRTHTCTVCGESASEVVAAPGHNWTVQSQSGVTCTTPAYTNSICLTCGETRSEQGQVTWSDWSEEYPDDAADSQIETKTQYRYREMGGDWNVVETGSVKYVASWPAGFDTNNSHYAEYNKTPVTASETSTRRVTINSDQTAYYIYYHWCRGSYAYGPINRAISSSYTSQFCAFHAFTSTENVPFDSSANAHNCYAPDRCTDTYWYFQLPVKEQTYTIEEKVANEGEWSSWSEWSDTPVEANDKRQVQTRTLYRHCTQGLAAHSWDSGVRTKEPTTDTEGEITYTCTVCGGKKTEYLPKLNFRECDHKYTVLKNEVARSCTEAGFSGDVFCVSCGEKVKSGEATPMLGHNYQNGTCTRCGNVLPTEPSEPVEPEDGNVTRISSKNRYSTAIAIAEEMKKTLNVDKFNTILIASGEGFADALAGTYLATLTDAPILLVQKEGREDTMAYVKENLTPGGKIYILGGKNTVYESVETALTAITPNVTRLAGSGRYDTCLKILEEAAKFTTATEVLICSANDKKNPNIFADSLSASAVGRPILLIDGSGTGLTDGQRAYLAGKSFVIIGGVNTVTTTMEAVLKDAGNYETRLSGTNRVATSIEIAKYYFPAPSAMVLADGKNYPDGLCGGALANAKRIPLLLTAGREADTAKYVADYGIQTGYVAGGENSVSDATARTVFGLAADAEIKK